MRTIITIFDNQGQPVQTIPAPASKRDGRALWCFLVSNLQSGFVVGLSEASGQISQPSGGKVPVWLFERLMRGEDLDQLKSD